MKKASIYANGRRFNRMTHDFAEIPDSAKNNVVAQLTKAAIYDEVVSTPKGWRIVNRSINIDRADRFLPIPKPSIWKKYFFVQ